MGWTVFQGPPQGGIEAAVIRSLQWGGRQVLVSARVGGELYAAVQVGDKVSACVALIEGNGYKLLSECEGPYYYACPPEVLQALTPTQQPLALKWRDRCAWVAS